MTSGAVIVMPRRTDEWADATGVWIAASGWARAARRRFGEAWITTPEGVFSPEEIDELTRPRTGGTRSPSARWLPTTLKTFLKDMGRWHNSRTYRVDIRPEWRSLSFEFVWQHHDLFHTAGQHLARDLHCPFVSFVHAPPVWEAASWGVRRPGWGPLLERFGEAPQLQASDVVACVSEEVADEMIRFGIPQERLVVCPTGVDAGRFNGDVSGASIREQYLLNDKMVVGWIGSFRAFHGLETLIRALASVKRSNSNQRLMLVGGGAGRRAAEELASDARVSDDVVFTGPVPFDDIPLYVAAMDIGVVSAPAGGAHFHYSPQKLREYMAGEVPVVAPRVGDVLRFARDGVDALLFDAGDESQLTRQLTSLVQDPALRRALAASGRELVLTSGTWDAQLERLLTSRAFERARVQPAPGA